MTRDQARAAGSNKYQGAPCHRGHAGMRYVLSAQCVECQRELRAANKTGKSRERVIDPMPEPAKIEKTRGVESEARDVARFAGVKRYEGRECGHRGHGTTRYVSTDHCCECCRLNANRSRKLHVSRSQAKPKIVEIPVAVPMACGVPLRPERISGGCRWIDGEVHGRTSDPDLFCGKGLVEGKPYCEEHTARAYTGKTADWHRHSPVVQR